MNSSATPSPAAVAAPAAVDLLWDEGQRRLLAQAERLGRLDSKTTPLLGFGVAAAAFFQANASHFGDWPTRVGTLLAALGILCTLAVMYPRTFSYTPVFRVFLRDGNRQPADVKTRYLGNLRTAIAENDQALETKTFWFKAAVWLYVATIAAAVGVIVGTHA